MKEELLKIVNHYGVMNQLKYIHSEYFELDEAVIFAECQRFEGIHSGIPEYCRNHITEEIADCYVMLEQIRHYYDIGDREVLNVMKNKIKRQLGRIDKGE